MVYSVKVGTRVALLDRILVAADGIRGSQRSCNEQLALFTAKRQSVLGPAVGVSKTCLMHSSV
jgi:hypothetical protein